MDKSVKIGSNKVDAMKKITLFCLTVIMALSMVARPPQMRSTQSQLRQINFQGHELTATRVDQSTVVPHKAETVVPENAVEVPVEHSLCKDDKDALSPLYTIIDANGDDQTWYFAQMTSGTVCLSSKCTTEFTDDWLITPAVHLFAGQTYHISFNESSATSNKVGRLEVKMGTSPTAEAMTTEIMPVHTFTGTSAVENGADFSVEADGYYYFGLHAVCEAAQSGNVKIANLKIDVAKEAVDPPAAGELSYELAPKGELKASIRYVAPTKTMGGADLTTISKVVISVNWGIVEQTFTDVLPGQVIELEAELLNGGNNKIEAIAYIDDTAGEAAVIKDFYCGPDYPLAPENIKITLSEDYKYVTLSWDAVGEVGENGGYVDPSSVVYYIFDAFGSYYDPAIAETTETSYTFDYSDWVEQDFVAYQVSAGFGEFYSMANSSDIVLAGPAEKLPFCESFENAGYDQIWAVDPGSSYNGWMVGTVYDNDLQMNAGDEGVEPIYLNSHDGDNGFFFAMPMEKDAVYGLQSGKIELSGAVTPVLEFHMQGKGSNVEVMVARDGGVFETVKIIKFKETPTDDWTLFSYDLSAYKDAKYIRIAFKYTAVDNTDDTSWSLPLDNIKVRDLASADLRLFASSFSAKVNVGEAITASARVENMGATDCSDAVVELLVDDKVVESKSLGLMTPGAFCAVDFSYQTNGATPDLLDLMLRVVCKDDVVKLNNSASAQTVVSHIKYATVTDLSATVSGSTVKLAWSAPENTEGSTPVAVVEDFENPDYEPMTISNFGGWTLYDGDGAKTYTILNESSNPYQTQPQAFQLFNPVLAGVPDYYMQDIEPHSGDQLLVAWSAGHTNNDNWLISPELSGDAQTISFFAKSFTIAYPETIEVLYSMAGTDIAEFVAVETIENYDVTLGLPEVWTEFKASIPAGAKHFAIRHTSYDTYALYLDDISYVRAPEIPVDLMVIGYNLYRDGVKINDEPIEGTNIEDMPLNEDAAEGSYIFGYQVAPVYNYGEARACEPITVTMTVSSISDMMIDEGPTEIYTIQGTRVSAESLTSGVYICTRNGKSSKIVIRK